MNRSSALELLNSPRAHERLLAARFLSKSALQEDADSIQLALTRENVYWIRTALSSALKRIRGEETTVASTEGSVDDGEFDASEQQIRELYSNALQETTSLLLHEIEPLLGKARLYARREIPNFTSSRVKQQLDTLDALLNAVSDLRRAAVPAKLEEIELSAVIREVKEQEAEKRAVEVQLAGPSPFTVIADRGRLWLALTNGLRNAIESTEAVATQDRRPVIINWNMTERDYWISIIDHGIGLKAGLTKIFEIGASSKPHHLGMGLPVVHQAVLSLRGEVTISPREDVGVKFEIRWPKFIASTT
jgi:signal transduction histidine kinase